MPDYWQRQWKEIFFFFSLRSFPSRSVLRPSYVYSVVTSGTALKDFQVFVECTHTHTHTLRCFHMRSYKDKWIQNWREIEAVVHIGSVGIILCAYEMPVCCRVASNFWKWAWCFIQSVWEKILHTADFSLILPHTVAELLYYWCELSGFWHPLRLQNMNLVSMLAAKC